MGRLTVIRYTSGKAQIDLRGVRIITAAALANERINRKNDLGLAKGSVRMALPLHHETGCGAGKRQLGRRR
jgi:hypothetical protein